MTQWPLQRDCNAFYGNPDPTGRGSPSRLWEDANLVRIQPPYPMVLAWDKGQRVHSILIHRLVAGALARSLAALVDALQWDGIQTFGLNLYGGSYAFRAMRGSHSLSMHSWGCAVDLAPEQNPFGRRWRDDGHMMPMPAVMAFQAEGFVWGGHWARPDAMHFQAARVR